VIFLISVSRVSRITGVSYQWPAFHSFSRLNNTLLYVHIAFVYVSVVSLLLIVNNAAMNTGA
jgi:hypothetical protein